jgi:hypothetical protein
MKHTPAMPLPLRIEGNACSILIAANNERVGEIDGDGDAAYIAHAANAYPELVEALSKLLKHRDGQIVHRASLERAEALLRSLGEDV